MRQRCCQQEKLPLLLVESPAGGWQNKQACLGEAAKAARSPLSTGAVAGSVAWLSRPGPHPGETARPGDEPWGVSSIVLAGADASPGDLRWNRAVSLGSVRTVGTIRVLGRVSHGLPTGVGGDEPQNWNLKRQVLTRGLWSHPDQA